MPCGLPVRSDMPRSLAVVLVLFVSACSIAPPEDSPRVAYREAESVQSLAVPPDLTRSKSPEALEITDAAAGAGAVLPEFDSIRMVRAGPLQWLEVTGASPEELWPRMSGFLRSEGLTIRTRRPSEGLIETAWAERFDAVPRGGLAGLFGKLLGSVTSDNIRDKYQIRLERMDGQEGTRIFLTHWAAQEFNTNPNTRDTPIIEMVRAEPDPAIAAEMRRRLLVYLGVSRARASAIAARDGEQVYTAPVRLVETKRGVAYAEIGNTSYRRSLGLIGEALRLIGAEVIETNESEGEIRLRWLPPKDVRGSGLFSDDRPRRLLLKLNDRGESVVVRAGDPGTDLSGSIVGDADDVTRSGEVHVALLERMVDAMGGDISSFRSVEDPEEDIGSQPTSPETLGY